MARLQCPVILQAWHECSQNKGAESRAGLVPEVYLKVPFTVLNVGLLVLDVGYVSNHSCLLLSDAQPLIRFSVCDSMGWEEDRTPVCDSFSLFPLLL